MVPPDFIYGFSETGMFLTILAVTGALAAMIHFIFRWRWLVKTAPYLADLSPVLQTLCGTLFVLSVTFLANSVSVTEDRARATVNEEARSIRIIRSYMDSMSGPAHDGMLKLLTGYADAVAAAWPTMAEDGATPQVESHLSAIYRAALTGFSEGDINRTIQGRLLSALDSLSQARQNRLSVAQEGVSPVQWFSVESLALLLLVVIAICHVRTPSARGVALGVVTLAISLALVVILAHDRPFIGYLSISPQPILDAVYAPSNH